MRTDLPLVESVLHATDFSTASQRAFAHALAIALIRQTRLTILHVMEPEEEASDWGSYPQVRETLERWNLLAHGSARTAVKDELNVEVRKISMRSGHPARAIVGFLDEHPHDLIVLATEGLQGGRDWLHRSDAESVARGSGAMSLFVPGTAHRGLVSLEQGELQLRSILVPVDGAIDFGDAIEAARRTAETIGDGDVVITLLHVGSQMPKMSDLPEGNGWTWQTWLRQGEPVDTILAAAKSLDADLIVMATNGRDTLGQALAGSTTERVLRRSDCPVLAVPEGLSR